jgi:hypothetical protein
VREVNRWIEEAIKRLEAAEPPPDFPTVNRL